MKNAAGVYREREVGWEASRWPLLSTMLRRATRRPALPDGPGTAGQCVRRTAASHIVPFVIVLLNQSLFSPFCSGGALLPLLFFRFSRGSASLMNCVGQLPSVSATL